MVSEIPFLMIHVASLCKGEWASNVNYLGIWAVSQEEKFSPTSGHSHPLSSEIPSFISSSGGGTGSTARLLSPSGRHEGGECSRSDFSFLWHEEGIHLGRWGNNAKPISPAWNVISGRSAKSRRRNSSTVEIRDGLDPRWG